MVPTRAKIVCTLGPSSNDPQTIKALVLAGMNVVRLNFSHGSAEEHRKVVRSVRQAARDTGRLVAIMLDLQGPKIRVGRFKTGAAVLEHGGQFVITTRAVEGDDTIVSTTYASLPKDVGIGDQVLLDDGLISLRVVGKNDTDLTCEIVDGGVLKNNKGINVPGVALSVSTLTAKDMKDVEFGIGEDVDYIAMSFVRQPSDIYTLKKYMQDKGASIPVIAKIEKPEALEYIDEIISVSDGIMVARGDLGVELPPEEVPAIQKNIILKCNQQGVPVITATQMLDSMVANPRPTRAEASDVANAILDGSDAVMLSAESASGKYPLESVRVMKRIISATEKTRIGEIGHRQQSEDGTMATHEGIAISACTIAEQVDASAIVSITLSGSMARSIAKHRPQKPIYAISQRAHELRRLSLVWGIEGVLMPDLNRSIDEAVYEVEEALMERGYLKKGDRMVFTAGLPFAGRQATNMVRVDTVR